MTSRFPQKQKKIDELAQKFTFIPIGSFELTDAIGNVFAPEHNTNGIYFFEIRKDGPSADINDWIANFQNNWTNDGITWHPGIKKRRILAHKSFGEWIPLYIGKSLSVGARIHEHIHQPNHKTTFSMKLKARKKFYGAHFRISWIPLAINNYHMIAPEMEKALRNKFNPIVGKQ